MKTFDPAKYSPESTDENKIEYVKTDSEQLNEILGGGLRTGNLVVVQAPSGAGKTTFMMRLFIRALLANKPVAYISIGEQDEKEVFERIACMYCKIDYATFIDTREQKDCEAIAQFLDRFGQLIHIYYSDDPFEVHEDAEGHITRDINPILKDIDEHKVKFIFMDYLGAVLADQVDSQYSYLTKIAAKLKNKCTDKNIMIMTAMQTNRPLKSELRLDTLDVTSVDETFMADSIGPARKASICMSLFQYKGQYYLNVFKNRLNGKLKAIQIQFKPINYEWVEFFNGKEGF